MKRFHFSTSLRHEPHDVRRPHAPGALSFRIAPLSASRHFASRAVWSVRSLHHVRSYPFYGGHPFLNVPSIRPRRAPTTALVSVISTWQAFYGCPSGIFPYQYSRAENSVDRPSLRSHPFNSLCYNGFISLSEHVRLFFFSANKKAASSRECSLSSKEMLEPDVSNRNCFARSSPRGSLPWSCERVSLRIPRA